MHHFFADPENINAGIIKITGPDVNHIKNVLRMKPGEKSLISDGLGTDYVCAVSLVSETEIIFEITDEEPSRGESVAKFYLFQGLPKADKFEQIIQKSVELGVYKIIPIAMKRSVVKYDEAKANKKRARWQEISLCAAKQSGRGIVPEVLKVTDFCKALEQAQSLDISIIPYENFKDMEETRRVLSEIKPGMKVGIFIGPEGGISEEEISAAESFGLKPISLGNRILRTETAPIMVLSVLSFMLET